MFTLSVVYTIASYPCMHSLHHSLGPYMHGANIIYWVTSSVLQNQVRRSAASNGFTCKTACYSCGKLDVKNSLDYRQELAMFQQDADKSLQSKHLRELLYDSDFPTIYTIPGAILLKCYMHITTECMNHPLLL